MDVRLILIIEISRVYHSPVLPSHRVAEAINPRFLKGYNIPILGVCCVYDVGVGRFGPVYILLPNPKFLWELGEAYIHWDRGGEV